MSSYQSSPATREKVLDRMSSILRVSHDTKDKEHKQLRTSCTKIIEFGYEKTEEGKLIYQYDPKNQNKFYLEMENIIDGSSAIEQLSNKEKTDMYRLENLVIPPNPLVTVPTSSSERERKDSGGTMERIFGRKKSETKANAPYQITIPNIRDDLNRIKRLDLFIEYQAYGVKLASKRSFIWMDSYRRFHYNRFQFAVAPVIIRKHKQYIEALKAEEKTMAVMVATALERNLHQTRMDMFGGGGSPS